MAIVRSAFLTTTALFVLSTPAIAQDVASADQKNGAGNETTSAGAAKDDHEIVVSGIRASLENALNVKRNLNAVVDVISAEGIGKFPDRNVAESLAHIPGVSVDHQFGIGERVSIQGTDPALNRILVDGHAIASADWGGNSGDVTGRTFNYSLLAPEVVDRIEVYKSPEPWIDEGSLGGTVIVRTRMPLDLKANTLSGSIGYNYNDRSKIGNPRGSLMYSWKNDSGTFGILVAGTYDKDSLARAGIEYFGYSTGADFLTTDADGNYVLKNSAATISGGSLDDLASARYPVGINHAYFKQTRERIGGQFAVQWAPTTDFELALTGMHIQGKYNNFSQSEFIYPGWATSSLTSATISNGLISSATFADSDSTQAELDMNYRKTKVTNDSYNLSTTWHASDNFTLSANGGWTKATGGKNPEYLMTLYSTGGYSLGYNGTSTNVSYNTVPTDTSSWGRSSSSTITLADGSTIDGYQIGGIAKALQKDEEFYGQVDGKWDIADSFITAVRMGVKASSHVNSLMTYGSNVYYTSATTLSDFDTHSTPSGLFSGLNDSGNANVFQTLTAQGVIDALENGIYVDTGLDESSSFRVREKTADAYVQVDFESGPIRGNVGYRMAYTRDISHYYLTTDSGSTYTPTIADKDYLKALPSINVSWDITDTLKLRGSIAEVIARPRYGQLAGAYSRDDTTLTASTGNPDLDPYQSTNYELSAEWYFRPGAMFSVEYFRRELSSYIVTKTVEEYLTGTSSSTAQLYSVSKPVNASGATVNGISANFQTPIWGGFGIQTNYTYANASAGTDSDGDVLNLPYLSKHTINVIPYFESGPFQARVSWNYRSHYFTGIGRLNSVDSTAGYHQLDASVSYNINDNFTLHVNAQNLLDYTYYSYSGSKSAPTAFYKNGRVFSATLQFNF
ncbi:TonB-dependent receptor [Novosphingobium sp. 1949]|uniref:TonB-dependent receptor n=1 Tax=Novosphingobium organovorum TaxID=2930092 RepID=A0ABT0BBN7_9SPHN|nr:TonB-dependent receptor [Novosphingobium organovorum]MCJ2182471.1 TonB-dependent receptor [Novosphingobium organovorum]